MYDFINMKKKSDYTNDYQKFKLSFHCGIFLMSKYSQRFIWVKCIQEEGNLV